MQRAIDFNISNFDETIDNLVEDQNLTTESFKTISNGTPTQSKITEKEHESWSTADADSIEEDLSEHDNVISKIDELLAEDFSYDHTDFYKDEENIDVLRNERTECITPLDSFKVEDSEIGVETGCCALYDKENFESLNILEVDTNNMIPDISLDLSSHKLSDSKTVSKNATGDTLSTEISIEQSETIIPKILPQVVSEIVSVSKSNSCIPSELSDSFSTKKSQVVPDSVYTVNSNSKISSEQSEPSPVKECQVVSKTSLDVESSARMLSDQSDTLTVNKQSETASVTTTVTDPTIKVSSEQTKLFAVKKPPRAATELVQAEDFNSKTISEQSDSFFMKKISEIATGSVEVEDSNLKTLSEQTDSFVLEKISGSVTGSVQVEDSISKTISEQSESLTVKKPSRTAAGSVQVEDSKTILQESDSFIVKKTCGTVAEVVQVEDSNSKIDSKQPESFIVKKPSKTLKELVQVEDSNSKTLHEELDSFVAKKPSGGTDGEKSSHILTGTVLVGDSNLISEQSECFVLKKPCETVIGSVQVDNSNSKTISENSESCAMKKSSEVLSETIQVVELKGKTSEVFDSLTDEKISSIVSASDPNTAISSGDDFDNKIKSFEIEGSSENHKSQSKVSKVKAERLSTTDVATNQAQDISLKKDFSKSEIETSVTLSKAEQVFTTEEENRMFDANTKKEFSQSPVEVSTTPIVQSNTKTEFNKTESNIPFESKQQTEKKSEQLPIKIEETIASTETSDTTVRRRVRKSSSQSATEPLEVESGDTKPDIPLKRRRDSRKASLSSPGDQSASSSSDISEENKTKPDIPEKRRRRPKPEAEPDTATKPKTDLPSLPPKTIRRDSSTDSISSSVFSSASTESLSCYESASLKDSSKSETTAEVAAVLEAGPEVPARKASLRQRRRESSEDTSSSINRSSSSRRSYDLPPKESMDLCRKRTSIDERMVKLQAAGKCTTKETAFIAAKLLEMQFDEEDALLASRQCSSIYHAVKFLTQLCELCQCRFPINSMASMIHCAHRACKECLKAHFTNQIYDRSIFTLLCPICQKPDITDQNIQEYFNHLEIMFRDILDVNVYDLFQRKLRDEVLTKDPNFHWCSQCSSGFIASPRLKKLYCPDCSAITCASCHQTWELEHEGVHCERFQQWKDMHTPEPPPAGLVKYLTDRGITCPSCDINYAQACGGCMMYKCSHCSYEFCGFCSQPCKRGKDCGNKQCELRGIHVHHPFTCLFFIRDKDISELQMLLDEESVKYLTIPPKDQIVKSRCQVREQKHTHGSITEDRCGRDIVPYCAGLCRTHYYEYLAELLKKNKINPLPLMTTQDLQFMLRKSRCPVPEKVKGETNEEFYERLTETVSSTLT